MEQARNEIVPISKNEEQALIPTAWRGTLFDIVQAFKDGDFSLKSGVAGVCPIPQETAARLAENITIYGAHLITLSDDTWKTSACQWMCGYWDALVDLFTAEEGASDLALAVRVYEKNEIFSFEIMSVHVP